MKHFLFLAVGSLLLAGTAHAQATFSVGPRVGLNLATAHVPDMGSSSHTTRAGFEAGLVGNVQFKHFAFQPSLLFSQKGYNEAGGLVSFDTPITYEEQVRLNYLTLPLNVAFTLGRDGQGLQAFAGPYVSLLLGGRYAQQARIAQSSYVRETSGSVNPTSGTGDFDERYAQRFDTGLQAGIGYRLGGLLVQASYSVGLRNLSVPSYSQQYNYTYEGPAYYNRAFQASLSYLVGTKG